MDTLTSVKYKLADYYKNGDANILKKFPKDEEIPRSMNLLTRFSSDSNQKFNALLTVAV